MRTYCTFKSNLRLENYLLVSSNNYGRYLHTALRIGTNKLRIDMDRRNNLEEKDRICKECNLNVVENELHFLVECDKYNQLRSQLFNSIFTLSKGKWNLSAISKHDCFIILINGTLDNYQYKIFRLLHSYLAKMFKLRVNIN